jgi:hypothetical protein
VPPGCAARARDLRETTKAAAGTAPRARAGPRQPHHEAPSPGQRGGSLPLLPTAPALRPQSGPDDLATELNPHKTELNPHQAVPGGQSHKGRSKRCLPCRAVRWAAGHGYYKGSRRMMGPPPAVPDIETWTSRLRASQGWSSRSRIDSRGLG